MDLLNDDIVGRWNARASLDQAIETHEREAGQRMAEVEITGKREILDRHDGRALSRARAAATAALSQRDEAVTRHALWSARLRYLPFARKLAAAVFGLTRLEMHAQACMDAYMAEAHRVLLRPSSQAILAMRMREARLCEARRMADLKARRSQLAGDLSEPHQGHDLDSEIPYEPDERDEDDIPVHAPIRWTIGTAPIPPPDAWEDPSSTAWPALPALPGASFGRLNYVRLPIGPDQVEAAVAVGARRTPRGAFVLDLPQDLWRPEANAFLPYFAKRGVPPIEPDLIPGSSWGSSLANLLTKSHWDAIRGHVIAGRGNICQICGEAPGPIECHELWAYSSPRPDAQNIAGVQRLMGMAAVCKNCHRMFHLGLANIQGRFEDASGRLKAVNRWGEAEFDAYWSDMGARYEPRCEVSWALDLSLVARFAPLSIKGSWRMDEDGWLRRDDPKGRTSQTFILGAGYSVQKQIYPAMPTDEALDGLMVEDGDYGFLIASGDTPLRE